MEVRHNKNWKPVKNKKCPSCRSVENIFAWKRQFDYHFWCRNCGWFWHNQGNLVDDSEEEVVPSPPSEEEVIPSPPSKKGKKEIIEICHRESFNPEWVDMAREIIFDISIKDDFFEDDYCPEELLNVIMRLKLTYEEKVRIKKSKINKLIEKACIILLELGIIEEVEKLQEKEMCSLLNLEWTPRKDAFHKKKDHRYCTDIIAGLRKIKKEEIWLIPFTLSLGFEVNNIKHYIELMNELYEERIIRIHQETEKMSGYKVKASQFNERELKKIKKIQEIERLKIERRRLEDLKVEEERRRKELEEEELKKREEERIKEIARVEKEREEIIKKREAERRVRELLEEVRRKEEENKKIKKLEWQKEIKHYTLIKILRLLYNQGSIDKRTLKSICEKLGTSTYSHDSRELMNSILRSSLRIQEKIETIINFIPSFIEKIVKFNLENYKPIRFSLDKEVAKQYLVEDLGGTYKYNPATDLNKPRIERQAIDENIEKENLDIMPAEAIKEETVPNITESQFPPKIEEAQKLEKKVTLKEGKEKLIAKVHNDLESFFENNPEQIELNSFLRATGYNLKEILDFFKLSGNESEFQLITVTKQINSLSVKRASLNKIKRELKNKSRLGIVEKKKRLFPLIGLLEKKDSIEMSVLCNTLNVTEDKLNALLRELEDYGEKHVTKIIEEQRSIKVIQKIRSDKV